MTVAAADGLELPENLKDIAQEAFMGDTSLTELVIPDGCESIGAYAFCDCKNLRKATIPDSVTSIGEHAFDGCPWLTIYCGADSEARRYARREGVHYMSGEYVAEGTRDGLIWHLTEDGDLIFEGEGVIPGYVSPYGEPPEWWDHRSSVVSVTVGEGITGLGDNAFGVGYSKLKRLSLSETVESIGRSAFSDCPLEYLYLPDSVTQVGASAFAYAPVREVRLSPNMKEIPENCFGGSDVACSYLQEIVIPEGIEKIGRAAFYNCRFLTHVELPERLRTISASAFYGCAQLPEIVIPAGVTSIDPSTGSRFRIRLRPSVRKPSIQRSTSWITSSFPTA